jgi:hypothetical protein
MTAIKMHKVIWFTANISLISTANGSTFSLDGTLAGQEKPTKIFQQTLKGGMGSVPLPGGIEMIFARDAMYLKMGLLANMLGKPWLKFVTPRKIAGLNLGPVFQAAAVSDPLAYSKLFSSSTKVRKVGAAVINGVPTTEYAGTFSFTALPPSMRAGVVAGGITTGYYMTWVDGQHLMRKIVLTESGGGNSLRVSILLTSINKPLNLHLPPASQVAVAPRF